MRLRRRQHRPGCDINIAPLIDVVFLLIIFFMLVSQFTRIEVEPLSLPHARHLDRSATPVLIKMIVNVYANGRVVVAGVEHTADSLGQLLQTESKKHAGGEVSVLIRSDRQAPWQKVSKIMEACHNRGVSRVRVATVPTEELANAM